MASKKSLVDIDFGGSSSIKSLPSATAASSDCLVITDESDGGKAKKGPSFGANDGTFLRKDGTWQTPSGGGAAKHLHNITAYWSGGSGSSYKQGSLSFSFQDSNGSSYAATGLTPAQFMSFMETHCGMTEGNKFPVNGTIQKGSPISELWFVTNLTAMSDLWYIGGAGISVNSSKAITSIYAANEEINYLLTAMEGNTITLYDVVL